MIWTSNVIAYPDGVEDQRMFGGSLIDGNGVWYGTRSMATRPFYCVYVNTETGLIRELKRTPIGDGYVMTDDGGSIMTDEYKLPLPIRLIDRNGQELFSLIPNV